MGNRPCPQCTDARKCSARGAPQPARVRPGAETRQPLRSAPPRARWGSPRLRDPATPRARSSQMPLGPGTPGNGRRGAAGPGLRKGPPAQGPRGPSLRPRRRVPASLDPASSLLRPPLQGRVLGACLASSAGRPRAGAPGALSPVVGSANPRGGRRDGGAKGQSGSGPRKPVARMPRRGPGGVGRSSSGQNGHFFDSVTLQFGGGPVATTRRGSNRSGGAAARARLGPTCGGHGRLAPGAPAPFARPGRPAGGA